MTHTSMISYAYWDFSLWGNILHPNGHGDTGGWKWYAVPIKERYAEISRIFGRSFISPFEMFGTMEAENRRYAGHVEEELRSGSGPSKPASRIFPQ